MNAYEIPSVFGGGGTLYVRMDRTDEDGEFNRTENTRVIAPSDADFGRLHTLRPDAESTNRGVKDSMFLRRAHSVGRTRIRMNLIGYGLMVNSLTLHLARQGAPPLALAA